MGQSLLSILFFGKEVSPKKTRKEAFEKNPVKMTEEENKQLNKLK